MELSVEDFIAKLHSLPGNAIGERNKCLNLLLTNIPLDHDAVIASLQTKTHLEQLFRLQLLIKLKRIPELVEILKSEDEHLVAKLLKNKWFSQKFASVLEENCAGFVGGVLPCMSYVTRRRLLKKLAIYGNNLDTVFEEVYQRYGLHIATDVLLGCTDAKIRDILGKCNIKFTDFQLKLLFKKFPNVFQLYIENQGDIGESVGSYVAAKDTNTFMELANHSNLIANLGKRLTKKLLQNFKEFIITNADKFINSLHTRTFIKTLGMEDFKRFYFKCFPLNIKYGFYRSSGFYNLVKKLGKRHYPLLLEGVKQQYNKSLYDYPDLVNQEMMETMEVTEREKWVAIKRKSEMDLIEFLNTSESIPAIKKKINVTSSVKERQNLIQLLVQTCKINQDVDALAEVAEYVSLRHRNDDSLLLTQFLFSLKHHFDLKKLEERHWKSIQSLISIIKLKENVFYHELEFATSHTEFLFNQKKLKEEDILKYIKNINTMTDYWRLEFCDEDLKKIITLKLIEVMPELMKKTDKLHHHDLQCILFIINWNKRHPDDQILISEYPRLLDSFHKSIKDAITLDEYIPQLHALKSILKLIICKNEKLDLRDEALKAYFLIGSTFYDLDIDLWLLKYQPETISANFSKFLEHLSQCYEPNLELLLWVKKYSHLAFPEKIVDFALKKLRENETRNNIFRILAFLSPSEKFLQCVSPYYPSEDKMDVDEDNEESKKKRDDAIEVACSFKYTTDAVILPTVLGYCKGDFLRYTLESMYYLFYHLPENKLSTFLNELSTKAVSARKHAIFLTCIVGSVADVKTLLTHFIEKERNVSVQKHLFTAALKYFTKNPSDDLWESVKICMTKLDKSDDESFGMLVKLREIPVKYQARHVVFVWEILKISGDEDRYKRRLLSSLSSSEVIKNLPLQFLLEIIADSFLKNQEVDEFIVSCLSETDFKTEILKAMFDVVLKLKMLRDENYENLGHHKRFLEMLGSFVSTFVSKIAIQERNEEILQLFARKWYELFMDKETEVIEEHLQITFARFYCQFGSEDLLKLNKANMDFLSELMMTYGIGIVEIFARILKKTFDFYNEQNKAFFDLCMDIIARNELIFYLLVIELLPKSEPSDNGDLEKFRKIIQLLRGTSANLILLSLNRYIRNISFS